MMSNTGDNLVGSQYRLSSDHS